MTQGQYLLRVVAVKRHLNMYNIFLNIDHHRSLSGAFF